MARVMRYDGIPTTRTVREVWDGTEWMEWATAQEMAVHLRRAEDVRKRTVVDPIYVVPQMLPCPECGGARIIQSEWDPDAIDCCPTCGGSGVVAPPKPDYITTWQVRHHKLGKWWDWHDIETDGEWSCADEGWETEFKATERRQVVAYKVTAIEPLPVVGDESPGIPLDVPWIHLEGDCGVFVYEGHAESIADDDWTEVTDEPWAADLTPGQVVWRLHLEALDQPYTEMVLGHPESTRAAVPLSVPVGEVTELELTR